LHLRTGERIEVAETDDELEAQSLAAARDSIEAVAMGRRFVEQAPVVAADVVTCGSCGAPVVPTEATTGPCGFCNQSVTMPAPARALAESARRSATAQERDGRLVALLLEQPDAHTVNRRLGLIAASAVFGWVFGWAAVGWRVSTHGWSSSELLYVAAPGLFVMSCAFFALATVSDRAALQTLALGYGALAPRREGEPPRCRRCHGPLGTPNGVVACIYCQADNIVGIDLRPVVDDARAQEERFDAALASRRSARVSLVTLLVVALLLTAGWLAVTVSHVAR
jgi:hypothetical protein